MSNYEWRQSAESRSRSYRVIVRAVVSGLFEFRRGAGLVEVICPDGTVLDMMLDNEEMPVLDSWQIGKIEKALKRP